ncbi:DUF2075 domain-containing protein, partial [Limosilactobacillus reuteri]
MSKKYVFKEFKINRVSERPEPLKNDEIGLKDQKRLEKGDTIYIYFGKSHSYVGQTKQFLKRYKQHYMAQSKFDLRNYKCVVMSFGQLINQLSLDDIENQLITYIAADGKHNEVLSDNSTLGNSIIPYPQQDQVKSDFITPFWHELYTHNYVHTPDIETVRQSVLFKYSPFHELSEIQAQIIQEIVNDTRNNFVINGMAGTGKTVMLTNLAAVLSKKNPNKKVAVIVKANWKKTAKRIFKTYGKSNIAVYTAVKFIQAEEDYDFVIIDESHRLRRYYSKSQNTLNTIFRLPPKVAEERGVNYDVGANELEKIVKRSKQIVLMYDPSQQIRPGDITMEQFNNITHKFKHFYLPTEYRINIPEKSGKYRRAYTGENYIKGI